MIWSGLLLRVIKAYCEIEDCRFSFVTSLCHWIVNQKCFVVGCICLETVSSSLYTCIYCVYKHFIRMLIFSYTRNQDVKLIAIIYII